ncbi:MAG: D-2-hydroxyacid dehydrogenase family protein [Vibrio sp.]
MKIGILDDYQNVVKGLPCFASLAGHDVTVFNHSNTEAELIEKLQPFDALVLIRERTVISGSLLSRLPNLKVISQTGKISHHIDISACHQYGVAILEGRGSPIAPAELCWALIMAASRQIPSYCQHLGQGYWQQNSMQRLGRTLHGLRIGIWGYGKIGQRIAQYARAFDMTVVIWGSESSRHIAQQDGCVIAQSKQQFFSECDVISLHLRLNDNTRHTVTKSDLRLMKSDSLFVNTSRAELVEPNALYHELSRYPNKQAAIDVFDNEPTTPDSDPLLSLPNVTATPHLGYVEQHSYEMYFQIAFDNLLNFSRNTLIYRQSM